MKYIWADYKDGHGFVPHMSFDDENDPNKGTTIMTDAQAEIQDLKDSGYGAKYGSEFTRHREIS